MDTSPARNQDTHGLFGSHPRLRGSSYRKTSCKSSSYNCMAWVVDDTERHWWPGNDPDYYWPSGIRDDDSLEAFLEFFENRGYTSCQSGTFEEGYEKVAIYAHVSEPQHIARQLPSGQWTSKLGICDIDIEHEIEGLKGGSYGSVIMYLSKPNPLFRVQGS